MGRLLLTVSALGICGIGVGSAATLIANAPAFNADLRRANVFDQSILQLGSEMYDLPDYLLQQAASYQRADLIPFSGPDQDQAAAPVEVAIARGASAVELMHDSLALAPSNAHGWTVMSWSQLYAGDLDAAQEALRISWSLAPYSYALSRERIDLALVLFDPLLLDETEAAPPLADPDRLGLTRDLEVIRDHYRNDEFGTYLEIATALWPDLEVAPKTR